MFLKHPFQRVIPHSGTPQHWLPTASLLESDSPPGDIQGAPSTEPTSLASYAPPSSLCSYPGHTQLDPHLHHCKPSKKPFLCFSKFHPSLEAQPNLPRVPLRVLRESSTQPCPGRDGVLYHPLCNAGTDGPSRGTFIDTDRLATTISSFSG